MGVVFQDRKSTNNICNNVIDVFQKTSYFFIWKRRIEYSVILYMCILILIYSPVIRW